MNNLFTKSILAASIAVSAGAVNAAMLEEIVVTAQQRSESLQDVPVSVAAVTAEKMSNAGIVDLQGLSELVPNFSINETGISTTVTIRGISSGINPGFEQSVGIYNDGIFYGRDQLARIPMMDMERVEILRGPQGILFGKNSIAGAVSQVSAKPTDDFQGSVTALYEPDHGEQDVRVVLSGPLSESFSGRIAILDRSLDGYVFNTVSGQDEQNEEEQVIRASLRWDVSDDMTANLKVSRSTFDTVGRNMEVYNSIGAPDHISVLNGIPSTAVASPVEAGLNYSADNNGHFSDNEVSDVTLTVDWDMDGFSLTSVTGFVEYEFDENCDCDFSGAAIFDAARQEEYEQFSQEFRFTSDLGGDFDYIGGLFFQSTELNYKDQISLPSPTLIGDVLAGLAPSLAPFAPGASTDRSFNQEGDLWAVFAQGTYTLTDEVRVTVGGRYTSETKDADRTQQHKAVAAFGGQYQPAVVADPISGAYNALWGIFAIEPYQTIVGKLDDSSFTPVVTVEWDANEDTMAYFTWTKGFKSGGFDARSNGHPDAAVNNAGNPISGNPITGSWEFDREEATSIELGSKMTLADGAAELNIALYMTEYSDLQVSQFDGTLGFNVTNAGEATVQGLEADGRWAVSDNVTLTGSAAYLDFNYDKFPNSQCYFGQVSDSADFAGLCDVSGERKEYTPELQANIGAAWMGEVGEGLILSASADLVYMDDYIYASNLDPRTMQKATTQVSARIAISDSEGNWEVALLGRNLTDETVINFGGNTPLGGTLTGGAGNSYYAFVNRPLNIALQAKYSF
ncbi:TonB-dependent receptor [Porticoccaceae bacterium]|nr:TonB-dependent receptor [Porticoccaceae bacterium]MDB9843181.1 TonB-dependent receptor [Porticoccaceae bacterium]MDC0134228.1 TonB-dependent receptor [Porticoccaceae bacterium]